MTVSNRKLQALINLAERPGTPAEGEVARAMLAKLGHPYVPRPQAPPPRPAAKPRQRRAAPAPPKRPDLFNDPIKVAQIIRFRFPLGSRVFFNAKGYPMNHPGMVCHYERAGTRLKVWFDDAPTATWIHAISDWGWHLTTKKMSKKTAAHMGSKVAAG